MERKATKTDVIRRLRTRCGLSNRAALAVFNAIFDASSGNPGIITELLLQGKRVVLPGFGTFFTRVRWARERFDPNTHRPVQVPTRTGAHFHAGVTLRRTVLNVQAHS